jgi:hypothetical protein
MQVQLDRLREQYEFASWSTPRDTSLLAWGFRLSGSELPGWSPHRIQQVDLPGEPPATLSVWRPAEGNGALLAVNVYECDDEAAARRHLLRLLGEFQGPNLQRIASPGDVAFAAGSAGVLFARGNLVAFVRSIERSPAPVAENAARLDRILDADVEPRGDGPEIDTLSIPAAEARGQRPIPIDAAASDRAGGPVWFRFRSDTGRLMLQNRRPAFTPSEPGPHEIEVTAIGATGVSERTLRIDAAPGD